MRILLDENVPIDILPVLQRSGHDAQSVNFTGLKGFQNGDLIERARDDFDLLLTRDKDFTSEYLVGYITATFGVVLLVIPQQRGSEYAAAFAEVWPIESTSLLGKVTRLG
jgi:predicted nuclease of predicted toxin-antitoxin system